LKVLVTRPAQDARRTIERLAARGIQAIAAPVLEIVPVPDAELPPEARALLVTSANAAAALSARPDLERLHTIPVYAVGDRTADAMQQAGFARIHSAGGSAADLLALVRKQLKPDGGLIVYPSGRDVAADLEGELRAAGYAAKRVVVYEAEPLAGLAAETIRELETEGPAAVLLYSPRSAKVFGELVTRAGLSQRLSGLYAVVMSSRVAAAAGECGFRHIFVADAPHESALLATLEELIKGGLED